MYWLLGINLFSHVTCHNSLLTVSSVTFTVYRKYSSRIFFHHWKESFISEKERKVDGGNTCLCCVLQASTILRVVDLWLVYMP